MKTGLGWLVFIFADFGKITTIVSKWAHSIKLTARFWKNTWKPRGWETILSFLALGLFSEARSEVLVSGKVFHMFVSKFFLGMLLSQAALAVKLDFSQNLGGLDDWTGVVFSLRGWAKSFGFWGTGSLELTAQKSPWKMGQIAAPFSLQKQTGF